MDATPPPHERPWRHPSELAVPVHEPARRHATVLVASTAIVALTVIGLLALSVTPGQPAVTTMPAAAEGQADGLSARRAAMPVVAPIAKPGLGLTTANGAAARREFDAALPDGQVVSVVAVHSVGDVTFVSLPDLIPSVTYAVAEPETAPDAVVTLQGPEPMPVPVADFGALPVFVSEGTPVTDQDGALVGLFSVDVDGTATLVTLVGPAPVPLPPPAPVTAPPVTTIVTVPVTLPVPVSEPPATATTGTG